MEPLHSLHLLINDLPEGHSVYVWRLVNHAVKTRRLQVGTYWVPRAAAEEAPPVFLRRLADIMEMPASARPHMAP